MNLKELIKQLTYEILNEEPTGTGAIGVGAGPIMTPRIKKKSTVQENSNNIFKYGGKEFKIGDKITYMGSEWTIEDIFKQGNMDVFRIFTPGLSSITISAPKAASDNLKEYSNYDQPSRSQASKHPTTDMRGGPSLATKGGGYYTTKENMNNALVDIIKEELLNEVTYNKFKNEVKLRTKNEQLHKAIREVKRKLSEIDRIVEYTSRMKQELSEGEDGLKYWKNTEKNVAAISEMVNMLNNKIKNLQQ